MRRRLKSRNKSRNYKKGKKPLGFLFGKKRSRRSMKKRDYALAPARNPYRVKKPISIAIRVKLSLVVLFFLGIVGMIIYHPFFYVDKFEISGLQRIESVDFTEAVKSTLNYKKLFVFPGQSYLFVSTGDISQILQDRFALQSIIVKKEFPKGLNIVVEEKISTVIYDNGKQYSYLGLDGNIVEIVQNVTSDEWSETIEITTTTLADGTIREDKKVVERKHNPALNRVIKEIGHYPLVFDKREKTVDVNKNVLTKTDVTGIIDWFNLMEKNSDIPFGYAVVGEGVGEVLIKTREGWEVLANLDTVQKQFDELMFLLDGKIDRNFVNYIDLRYEGRVYWQ